MDKVTVAGDEGFVYYVHGFDEEMNPGEDAVFVVGYFSALLKASRAAEKYALEVSGIEDEDVSKGWQKNDDSAHQPWVIARLSLCDQSYTIWVEKFPLNKVLTEA